MITIDYTVKITVFETVEEELDFSVTLDELEDDNDIGGILYEKIEKYVANKYCSCSFNESVNHCECEIEWDWNHEYTKRKIG